MLGLGLAVAVSVTTHNVVASPYFCTVLIQVVRAW